MARRGAKVYVASRSQPKGEAAAARIAKATGSDSVRFLLLDLADLASVRACARAFLDLGEPLHVLINNAGVGGTPGLTRDGFELVFGVNHLGHFALTMALLDCLKASTARIVTVASDAHYQARGIDFDRLRRRTRGITGLREYAVSKLCNVLFGQELARRLDGTGVSSYSLHPGVVASDIWRRVPAPVRPLVTRRMLTIEQGARTSLHCATAPKADLVSGAYYENCAVKAPSPVATRELGERLWEQSEAWTQHG
ncbi:MAG: SDR family NAD(P)-dependent oxidoreductase [Actinobacteria bacterium]|nr:SDR family NAD(P)-dependent oxidoreductase [Actinomycetota bacterium]